MTKAQKESLALHEKIKHYQAMVIAAYIRGEENALETYREHFVGRPGESDIEFILRCADCDFSDGEESLVYLDLWEKERIKEAAPDMLDALQEIVDADDGLSPELDNSRSAIAKAKGE